MLRELHIQNYALINKLQATWNDGMTVITGETGAGKSILLGALSLILGNRADSKSFLDSKKKVVIEGWFQLNPSFKPFFIKHDLDFESLSTLRREIHTSGKSRAFVNDTPVTNAVLKQLGEQLVDIHGQHEMHFLSKQEYRVQLIDAFAGNQKLLNKYQKSFQLLSNSSSELNQLKSALEEQNQQRDFLDFQLNELLEAQLVADEIEALEDESKELGSAEQIIEALKASYQLLEDDGRGTAVIDQLRAVLQICKGVEADSQRIAEIVRRIESTLIEVEDISSEVASLSDSVEVNPMRLSELEERLNTLNHLCTKHRVNTTNELLLIQTQLDNQLQGFSQDASKMEALEEEVKSLKAECHLLGDELHKKRIASVVKLEKELGKTLKQLALPDAIFKVEVSKTELNKTGCDEVHFLFCANKGGQLQSVSKVASGGEMSRLMLALKKLMGEKMDMPTVIFDEIDSGVSGKVGVQMAQVLGQMSKNQQVIAISHLPQMAAQGNSHYKVLKTRTKDGAYTSLKALNTEERIMEIAQMISGAEISKEAEAQAIHLLNSNSEV